MSVPLKQKSAVSSAPVQAHLRKTFLAGAFAVIPIAVTVVIVVYAERLTTAPIERLTGRHVYGLGLVLAAVLIYAVGLFVTSFVGRTLLRWTDAILNRLPLLRELYKAWKQVSLSPGGGEGIYGKVVLVPDGPPGAPLVLAFSTGEPIAPGATHVAAFVPNVPNPVTGRVVFVRLVDVVPTTLSAEEAFKMLLSSGNYVSAEIAVALAAHPV